MGFQGARLVVNGFWNGSGMGDRRSEDKMSLSYKVAMDLLAEKDDFDFNDLGFVTTVLMDST